MTHTISDGTIYIYTFKDGVLSRLGHDLRLAAKQFSINVDSKRSAVEATFSAASIVVEAAVKDGKLDPGELSLKDKHEIRQTMGDKVLHQATHPEIRFSGSVESENPSTIRVCGQLDLHGRSLPLSLDVKRGDGRLAGSATLVPSRWGIRPYKALMGALRVQDRVEVRFDLPDIATR